jgi:hypothetical protein
VELHRFHDLAADRVDGREGGHRLLEDHGNLIAAHAANQVAARIDLRQIDDVAVATPEVDRSFDDPAGLEREKPEDGISRHRLAAARFAHQAHCLPRREAQRHAIHRPHDAVGGVEVGLEVFDVEQITRR